MLDICLPCCFGENSTTIHQILVRATVTFEEEELERVEKSSKFLHFQIQKLVIVKTRYMLVACFQDKNGTIENEELNGFLKDLTELVQQVTCI